MRRTRLLTAACVVLLLSQGSVAIAAPAAPTAAFCYQEPVNPAADVSDLRRAFRGSNWLATIQGVYKRRWPSGAGLATAQARDPYFPQFVDTSSFEALAESLMVAIHEETHMWDLDGTRTSWDVYTSAWITASQQALRIPLHGGFPRREILPLITDNLTRTMDDIYLRDSEQGGYLLQGVTAELNAGLMGLPAVTVLAEYIKGVGASNARDIVATNVRYLELYLRVAKSKHPDYWTWIKAEPVLRDFVLTEFLRSAYWLDKSAPHAAKLGSADVPAIVAKNYAPENLGIVEEFTGRRLSRDPRQSCTTEP